jgi:hypothetical protein
VTAQDALLALGAAYFDSQAVRSSIFRNQQVAVFLNLGAAKTGYIAPAGVGFVHIDSANIHVQVPELFFFAFTGVVLCSPPSACCHLR